MLSISTSTVNYLLVLPFAANVFAEDITFQLLANGSLHPRKGYVVLGKRGEVPCHPVFVTDRTTAAPMNGEQLNDAISFVGLLAGERYRAQLGQTAIQDIVRGRTENLSTIQKKKEILQRLGLDGELASAKKLLETVFRTAYNYAFNQDREEYSRRRKEAVSPAAEEDAPQMEKGLEDLIDGDFDGKRVQIQQELFTYLTSDPRPFYANEEPTLEGPFCEKWKLKSEYEIDASRHYQAMAVTKRGALPVLCL
ncbi:hypothetical protein HK101_008230 [Irineochytrium annulatum]|nr:hypothetical protein HK101_008230 [Irineochytrium annulatum]